MLPADLIDHTFSFLGGDTRSLKACSKAHPLCSRLAERYLYADTEVVPNNECEVSELYEQLSENSRILDYIRTLEFRHSGFFIRYFTSVLPEALSIMSMIPRMANLVSLKICEQPCSDKWYEDFLVTLRTCLQQSVIEEVCLESLYDFPLSVLDNGKHIKTLMLSDCKATEEPWSDLPHHSLETLIISGNHNPELLFWTARRATSLTTLELRNVAMGYLWIGFPELLTACSNSLKKLKIDVAGYSRSMYTDSRWFGNHLEFPFTLPTHTCLEELSIFAWVHSNSRWDASIHCALPAIIRLIKTAPSIPNVFLHFDRWEPSDAAGAPLDPLDVPPLLDLLRSDFAGIRPSIDLHIHDAWGFPPDLNIPDVLTTNEA